MAPPRIVVGVDWGTTHRRGFLLIDGALRAEASDAQGALAARGGAGTAMVANTARLGQYGRV